MIETYIDESGTFVPIDEGLTSVSVVGALVVPSVSRVKLFNKYQKLRSSLPKNSKGEVKGSKLDEDQVDKVIDLLKKNDCIFEGSLIDMRRESYESIISQRDKQAAKITEHLTDEFDPEAIARIWELRRILEASPPQLYVQSTISSQVICQLICLLPTYFVQRWPNDLDEFHWIIDGKGAANVTPHEEWWEQTICPLLQSRSVAEPIITVQGLDYRIFEKAFLKPTPEYLKGFGFKDETGIDLGALLRDHFRFSSKAELGLELVDIVTNAFRRAFNGNLKAAGYARLPELMIHRKGGPVVMKTFGAEVPCNKNIPYFNLLSGSFSRGGRSMLTGKLDQLDSD